MFNYIPVRTIVFPVLAVLVLLTLLFVANPAEARRGDPPPRDTTTFTWHNDAGCPTFMMQSTPHFCNSWEGEGLSTRITNDNPNTDMDLAGFIVLGPDVWFPDRGYFAPEYATALIYVD